MIAAAQLAQMVKSVHHLVKLRKTDSMKINDDQKEFLERGGRPTLGDLLEKMKFSPADGNIRLSGARMILQRASVGADIQDQLVKQLGAHDAQVFLMRLGYRAGREDADFIKENWPNLEIGDAFTAGTRLHMLTGTVRVETMFNDFDFRNDRYASEFLWHDSVEAVEYQRRHGRALAPVCWAQTGYATGYASQFFRKLVLFKEVHCSAMGHKSCRVLGKTTEGWGINDPYVQMFMNEVLHNNISPPVRSKSTASSTKSTAPKNYMEKVLVPVQSQLNKLAQARLPALITGACGTGRALAAQWLHDQVFSGQGTLESHAGSHPDLSDLIDKLEKSADRRHSQGQTLVIENIEDVPAHLQDKLIRLSHFDARRASVLVIGLSTQTLAQLSKSKRLSPTLLHGIGVLPVEMPLLSARKTDIPRLAQCMLDQAPLNAQGAKHLSDAATDRLARAAWPDNLPELRATLHRATLLADDALEISVQNISDAQDHAPRPSEAHVAFDDIWAILDPAFAQSDMTIDELNTLLYHRTVEVSNGNLSEAARKLGLSRAQLAYRLRSQS
ncbi:MAG: transcriptional regulator with AAA-type ATPase domain [Celeribacter sp.]|jgi:transcriptional regulator with AAA-type ATPase domain